MSRILPRLDRRTRQEAFTLGALAGQLTGAADGLGALTGALFGRLFEVIATLHFAESAFPLHLLLERLQRLIDVVIANENLYQDQFSRNPKPKHGTTADASRPRFRLIEGGAIAKRRAPVHAALVDDWGHWA